MYSIIKDLTFELKDSRLTSKQYQLQTNNARLPITGIPVPEN